MPGPRLVNECQRIAGIASEPANPRDFLRCWDQLAGARWSQQRNNCGPVVAGSPRGRLSGWGPGNPQAARRTGRPRRRAEHVAGTQGRLSPRSGPALLHDDEERHASVLRWLLPADPARLPHRRRRRHRPVGRGSARPPPGPLGGPPRPPAAASARARGAARPNPRRPDLLPVRRVRRYPPHSPNGQSVEGGVSCPRGRGRGAGRRAGTTSSPATRGPRGGRG